MSQYYNAQRTRNLYDPNSDKPFKLSRSKIDLFLNCSKCFYLDRRLGVGRPPGFPFNLNSAVDNLLKTEFDDYRKRQEPHPLMADNGIDAVPFLHEKMDEWRDSLRRGVQYHDVEKNLIITGGVDDVWITPNEELIIVDYKATSKKDQVSLNADWQIGYKRQMDIYSWLFKKNGFKVYPKGFFVYCNGDADAGSFNNVLNFETLVLPYDIDDGWVDQTIKDAHKCLSSEDVPMAGEDCDYCAYSAARQNAIRGQI